MANIEAPSRLAGTGWRLAKWQYESEADQATFFKKFTFCGIYWGSTLFDRSCQKLAARQRVDKG
jgi:hypothetical protein